MSISSLYKGDLGSPRMASGLSKIASDRVRFEAGAFEAEAARFVPLDFAPAILICVIREGRR